MARRPAGNPARSRIRGSLRGLRESDADRARSVVAGGIPRRSAVSGLEDRFAARRGLQRLVGRSRRRDAPPADQFAARQSASPERGERVPQTGRGALSRSGTAGRTLRRVRGDEARGSGRGGGLLSARRAGTVDGRRLEICRAESRQSARGGRGGTRFLVARADGIPVGVGGRR